MTHSVIDIHSHILPGLDDGASTMEDAVKMAEAAVKDGITHLYATPHHRNGRYENEKELVIKKVEVLNAELKNRKIPLNIIPGQEIRMYKDLIKDIDRGRLLPLHNKVNYLLIELPSSHVPNYAADILFELSLRHYQPILVHPERNSEILENPEILYECIMAGTHTQITATSIIGHFGKKIMNFSHELIQSNMVHFLASDAHHAVNRGFHMSEVFGIIQKRYGVETRFYLQENAAHVLRGESILIEPPSLLKRKRFLGIF